MKGGSPSLGRLNLEGVSILVAQSATVEMELLAQILSGFGVWSPIRCETGEAADAVLNMRDVDVALIDASLSDTEGYDMIQRLRRNGKSPNRNMPIVLVAGYIRRADINRARDCGANFVVLKPLTPRVLYERIAWLSRDQREFIDVKNYCGPDRRLRALGPPVGSAGRRKTDLSAEVGAAKTPNLSQNDIDNLFAPQKVSL